MKGKNMNFFLAAIIALLVSGCGESSQPPPQTKLLEPERETMDKAKGVEQIVTQQADQQKQDTEQQTE